MTASSIQFCIICAVAVASISLLSSHLYKKEQNVRSEMMALVSFLPGFLLSAFSLWQSPFAFSRGIVFALLVKNFLYSLSFYYRYESLKKFGPFVGALMLGTQPIVVFFLAFVFLGEKLSIIQISSLILASASLLLLVGKDRHQESQVKLLDFAKYYALPALASGLAIVWDRFFLKGQLPSQQFFVLDRISILPSFLIMLFFLSRGRFAKRLWISSQHKVFSRNWVLLSCIGSLFTVSVYAYNLALVTEKAALVGLARNSAYPIAAFAGTFIFEQKVTSKKWLSFALIISAVILGAF